MPPPLLSTPSPAIAHSKLPKYIKESYQIGERNMKKGQKPHPPQLATVGGRFAVIQASTCVSGRDRSLPTARLFDLPSAVGWSIIKFTPRRSVDDEERKGESSI